MEAARSYSGDGREVAQYSSQRDIIHSSYLAQGSPFDQGSSTCEDLCDMFLARPGHAGGMDDLKVVLTPSSFEEDDEMAAACDVVTADFKTTPINCTTPPPGVVRPGVLPQPHLQQQAFKQEPSGAAGSTCGGSSPQVSCDTAAARAQHFWAPQQQQQQQQVQYEAAAYGLILEHSPVNDYSTSMLHGGYAATSSRVNGGGPCTGPCCNPAVAAGLMPQGSSSLPAMADYSALQKLPGTYPMAFGHHHGSSGGASTAHMVPTGSGQFSSMHTGSHHQHMGAASAHPAAGPNPSVLHQQGRQLQHLEQQPRGYGSSYPPVQGGVQKKAGTSAKPPTDTYAARRRSGDGSCSSKDGPAAATAPASKAKKSKAASTAAAAASSGPSGGRSRGSTSTAGQASVAAGAAGGGGGGGSPAALIKELQHEVEQLSSSKAQLKAQLRNLLNSQTDLLSRVSTLTTKWQQAVAENAALQRQVTQMAGQGL